MARNIDYANLTEDDFVYLSTRSWLVAEGDYQGHETSKALSAWQEDGTLPEKAADNDGEEATDEDGIEYKDANVEQLKAELESRGLETTGKKAELIARLEANDAETADEEDDEEDDEE